MGLVAASKINVTPSLTLPEHIVQINQASGYFELLSGGDPMPRLGQGDLYVYVNTLDIRTQVQTGQQASNQLPGVIITAAQVSTPTYLIRGRAEFDHHDQRTAGDWNFSLPEGYRLGMRQGFFQKFRDSGLYGINAANGEGILNASNITTVNLPTDPFGNSTIITYDNGAFAQYMLQVFQALLTRTMQLGLDAEISVCAPQRVLGQFDFGIVQLTNYQRQGAGSNSAAGTIKDVAGWNDIDVTWTYDDTLIGKGSGGTDAIVVVLTKVRVPKGRKINTNEFAKLAPNMEATVIQLCDMIAPKEITAPLPGGAVDVTSEERLTSGWPVRPEAVTVISAQYS